ncbi:MAG: hypothetical protein ACI9PY_000863 [Ascidiaceihabitans sp.]|jgi:hypothetical protein
MTIADQSLSVVPDRPQIILHVGHEKCGSKTIQQFLRDNQADLLAEGIYCPKLPKIGNYDMGLDAYGGNPASLQEFAKVNGLSASQIDDFDAYFEAALVQEITQVNPARIAFSFEGLLCRSEDRIRKIGALLQKISSNIRVFAIARKQDNWAISAYTTRLVHTGSVSQNVLRNDDNAPHGLRYHSHLRMWESATGGHPVLTIAFEDHPDVLVPFKQALGTQIPHDNLPRSNSSLSAHSQEILRNFNLAQTDNPTWHKNRAAIRNQLFALLPRGAPKLPPQSDVDAFMQVYAEENLRLKWDYLPQASKYFDRRHSFPPQDIAITISSAELNDWVGKAIEVLGPKIKID